MNVTSLSSSDYLLATSKEYSIYVCETRAIPKVTDGLKDGQRKALWLLRTSGEKRKTIGLSGEMLQSGLYHHGDASANETIGKLAAPYLNNLPFIEGIGAFGTKVDPAALGAPRYTSIKRSKNAEKLLYLDLDLVPQRENYDGSTMEPITFLPIIPTVLLNGVNGIAVAWSTNILPRSPDDLKKATLQALDGKKVSVIKPTYTQFNCDIQNEGGNSWSITGKFHRDGNSVIVTDLPPDLLLEKFKDKLDQLEDLGKIQTYDDDSTDEIKLTIRFKRNELAAYTDEQLIDLLKLRVKKTERIVVINWTYDGIKEFDNAEILVEEFVKWRFAIYVDRYAKRLADANEDLMFYKSIKACFDGKLPSKLQAAQNKKEIVDLVAKFTKAFAISDSKIDYIASFPSYRWAKDAYDDVVAKIAELEASIIEYTGLLGDHTKIKKIFRDEVAALKF